MQSRHVVACLLISILSAGAHAADSVKIKKCRDAQGKWHYGDHVEQFCGQSKITVINDRGLKVKEIEKPLTAEEAKARERQRADAEAAKHRAKEQQQQDQQLLATYTSENDITQMRDRRLGDIDAQIRASEETLHTLRATLERMEKQGADPKHIERTRAQVSKHESALEIKRQERQAVVARFAEDAQRYRALRGRP